MPSLLRLAGEPAPARTAVEELSKTVEEALATAEAAKYRIDQLLGTAAPAEEEPPAEEAAESVEEGIEQAGAPEP